MCFIQRTERDTNPEPLDYDTGSTSRFRQQFRNLRNARLNNRMLGRITISKLYVPNVCGVLFMRNSKSVKLIRP